MTNETSRLFAVIFSRNWRAADEAPQDLVPRAGLGFSLEAACGPMSGQQPAAVVTGSIVASRGTARQIPRKTLTMFRSNCDTLSQMTRPCLTYLLHQRFKLDFPTSLLNSKPKNPNLEVWPISQNLLHLPALVPCDWIQALDSEVRPTISPLWTVSTMSFARSPVHPAFRCLLQSP